MPTIFDIVTAQNVKGFYEESAEGKIQPLGSMLFPRTIPFSLPPILFYTGQCQSRILVSLCPNNAKKGQSKSTHYNSKCLSNHFG